LSFDIRESRIEVCVEEVDLVLRDFQTVEQIPRER
jgi:hypothetical protein